VILPLPYDKPPLSLNGRYHWARKAALAQGIKSAVFIIAKSNRVPRMGGAHVTLHWVPKDKRRRDTDNPIPTLKACIDGLVKAGVVPDDSSEYVSSEVVIDPVDKNNPRLYLSIEERV